MDKLLPKLYKEYGQYSNWRNFPYEVDGLKPVERRILFSAFQIARNKLVKSARVDGHVIGNYHPHGSSYGSIVQLVRQDFLDGQGNFGSNIGVEAVGAAASRYTEIKLSKKTENLAFKYIEHIPWFINELDVKEPTFLPAMFPLCLLGNEYTQGIGFGYKTYIPCYKMEDLHKRLLWWLGERKTKPTIIPKSDCKITSSNKELEELLTTGKAKIDFEGIIDEIPQSNKVILRSWPPGRKFESILKKFSKELDSSLIGYNDASSRGETKIEFEVLRERNRDSIYKDFTKKLKDNITGSVSFEVITTDIDGNVKLSSIDEMLLKTFSQYTGINQEMLNDKKEKLNSVIEEYRTLEIIRPSLSNCFKSGYGFEESIDLVSKETPIQKEVIEELVSKYRIRKLLTLDTDTKNLENEIKEIDDKLKNLQTFVLNQYSSF
ncbi:MAG: DNA gyrase subunit A [Candidatus Thorarchaeota archaeon]|jgi:DNA gyrase/topoisomerase IV subunit A